MDVVIIKRCTLKKQECTNLWLEHYIKKSFYKILTFERTQGSAFHPAFYMINRFNSVRANVERFNKITTKQELHKLLEKGYTLYDKEKTISDIEKLLSE